MATHSSIPNWPNPPLIIRPVNFVSKSYILPHPYRWCRWWCLWLWESPLVAAWRSSSMGTTGSSWRESYGHLGRWRPPPWGTQGTAARCSSTTTAQLSGRSCPVVRDRWAVPSLSEPQGTIEDGVVTVIKMQLKFHSVNPLDILAPHCIKNADKLYVILKICVIINSWSKLWVKQTLRLLEEISCYEKMFTLGRKKQAKGKLTLANAIVMHLFLDANKYV